MNLNPIQKERAVELLEGGEGVKIGQTFTADAYGYRYVWQVTTEIFDANGREPYVYAKPIRRISGKAGRLRSQHVWLLSCLPKQNERP